jgi:hypothetical protein
MCGRQKHGPLGPAKINEVSSFLDAQGQWFFDPHVFAGVNGFAREREVRRGGVARTSAAMLGSDRILSMDSLVGISG